jgi:fumarylacetoacetase
LQNLPFGRVRKRGSNEPWRIGVAIGEQVLDLKLALSQCPWPRDVEPLLQALAAGDLRELMQRGGVARRQDARRVVARAARRQRPGTFLELCLVKQADIELTLPCRIGDYTDFYTGIHHAPTSASSSAPTTRCCPTTSGCRSATTAACSSIGVSGQRVAAPRGQLMRRDADAPVFEPRRLDYELELGVLVGGGNRDGTPLPMAQAEDALVRHVLLNDWSARDIQAGNTSRSGRSCRRTSAPRSRRGSSRRKRWRRFARRSPRPTATRSRCRTSIRRQPRAWRDRHRARGVAADRTMRERPAPHRLSQSNFRDAYWTVRSCRPPQQQRLQPGPGDLLAAARSRDRRRARAARCSS